MATKLTFRDSVTKNNATPSPAFTNATYTMGANETVSFELFFIIYEPASTGILFGTLVGLAKTVSGSASFVGSSTSVLTSFVGGGYDDDGAGSMTLVGTTLTPKVTGTANGKTSNWEIWIDYYI